MYGLPKRHKLNANQDNLKVRPIISSINTFNDNLAKYLCNKLSPHIHSEYSTRDTFSFVSELNKIKPNAKYMISFDVNSLFTNIPLNETIEIAVKLILDNEPNISMTENELKKLFYFATSKSHFLLNDEFFDQIDGVAMGSPLGPVLANVFMGFHEKRWIENFHGVKPCFYTRYVDDIFSVFTNEEEALLFFEYLNKQHTNITFTYEKEVNGTLSFLDVLIKNTNNLRFETSVFRKKTFTGLLTNFLGFLPHSYKLALIKTLIHRIYQICNNWKMFHLNLKELRTILSKNLFPPHLIDKTVKNYLNDRIIDKNKNQDVNTSNKSYFKLPYVGEYSTEVKNKISNICETFCKSTDIRISFSMTKVGDLFSVKSRIPDYLKSFVVYHFVCAGCGASYVGETTRYFLTRIREHLSKSSSPTNIFLHLDKNIECRQACDEKCFKIIDSARTKFSLKVKEAFHINWLNPCLNKQKNHLTVTISV